MTIKVRSSAGDQESNVTTVQVDSPPSITVGDLLVIRIHINDDRAQTVTPPSGFTLNGQASNATANSRVMEWSKTAVAADATNQGTANYYDFSGFADSTDDYLFCCLSVYDNTGASVGYQASSLAGNQQSGGTTSNAPTQTIGEDLSLCIASWTARGGSTPFNIAIGETFSEANLANEALYQDTWTNKGQSGATWAVGTGEASTSGSPTGTLDLSHDSVSGSNVFSVSSVYEASAPSATVTSAGVNDWNVVFNNELRVEIDGTGFEAAQGGGSVTLNDTQPSTTTPSVSNSCAVRSWSDTQIIVDIDADSIPEGDAWIEVTTDGAATAELEVAVKPDPGASAVGLRRVPAARTVEEGTPFSLDMSDYFFASDVQDTVTFSIADQPAGIDISAAGTISGTIAAGEAASSPFTVTVTATDSDGNTADDEVTWTVTTPTPNPPNESPGGTKKRSRCSFRRFLRIGRS